MPEIDVGSLLLGLKGGGPAGDVPSWLIGAKLSGGGGNTPIFSVTDLDSLPEGFAVYNSSNVTISGNNISKAVSGKPSFSFHVKIQALDGVFENGQTVEIALKLNSWSGNYLRVYARAHNTNVPIQQEGTAGYLNWISVPEGGEFASGGAIGSDANKGYRVTNSLVGETLIYKCVFANLSESFVAAGADFTFGAVGYDWASASATFDIDFLYYNVWRA